MTDSHPGDPTGDRAQREPGGQPGPDGHLDLDGLADHLAGQVDAGPHLASCGGCTARLAELEAAGHLVQHDLRALPSPPLPADVSDRLAAVLAAEPPLSADSPVTNEPPPAATSAGERPDAAPEATVLPLAERRRRPWLPSVAAGVVLLAGGLLGYAVVSDSGSDGQQAGSVATGTGGVAPEQAPPVPTVRSGLDYADAAALRAALPGILAGTADTSSSGAAARRPAPSPLPADPLARLRDPAALADCLAALRDPGQPAYAPLVLDYAAYDGAPALAVVGTGPSPGTVEVYLLGPRCSLADSDLRQYRVLPRP